MTAGNYTLKVNSAAPDEWSQLSEQASLFAQKMWIDTMGERIEGKKLWWTISRAEKSRLGLFGSVVDNPNAYELQNVHTLLTSTNSVFKADKIAHEMLIQLQEQIGSAEEWFPNLIFTYPGYECFPIGPGYREKADLEALISKVVDWGQKQELKLITLLYAEEDGVWSEVLTRNGFSWVPLTHCSNLYLSEGNFEIYLQSLTHPMRKKIRRERKQMRELGLRTEVIPLEPWIEEMVHLRCANKRKYGHEVDQVVERRRFERLKDMFGEQITVFGCKDGDQLLSFTLFIRDRDIWHAFFTGSEYDDPRAKFTYFENTFYQPVEQAAVYGVTCISYGHAATDAKRRRGCRLTPVGGWIKALCPTLIPVIRQIAIVRCEWEKRERSRYMNG
ncbi:GNAT family N-acetyltransferase [Thermoflavimicrobium daqui]|nr:GNAT family N-acetyltransferase [Thermoflavimicrobium daqui]